MLVSISNSPVPPGLASAWAPWAAWAPGAASSQELPVPKLGSGITSSVPKGLASARAPGSAAGAPGATETKEVSVPKLASDITPPVPEGLASARAPGSAARAPGGDRDKGRAGPQAGLRHQIPRVKGGSKRLGALGRLGAAGCLRNTRGAVRAGKERTIHAFGNLWRTWHALVSTATQLSTLIQYLQQ